MGMGIAIASNWISGLFSMARPVSGIFVNLIAASLNDVQTPSHCDLFWWL